MHRRLWGLVAACAIALFSFASESKVGAKPATATEKQLLALTREWADAEVKRDGATLRRVMDDRFIATFGTGQPINKTDYIKAVVDDPDAMLSQTLTDETIRAEGDAAVLVGTVAIRSTSQGQETTTSYRYTATYVKPAGRWVALALHMVRVAPTK